MRLKLPEGNAIILAVLRSPLHRLLSGQAVELRYTGRRSGREYVLPVQYVRDGDRLILRPQGAERKTWWRNFRTPQPVTVRLVGRVYEGTAQAVDRADQGWADAHRRYAARWREAARHPDGPYVVISLHTSRHR